tara:strand:- start:321 stop:1133 length:813 start_codon:yes stop_codon:yes gene_type:complete
MEISDLDNILELDLYEVLDVSIHTSFAKIKKAYKSLIIRVHPDKVNGDAEQFELVNLAYSILKNDKLRKAYDNKRKEYLCNKDFIHLKNKKKDKVNLLFPKDKNEALTNFNILENELNEKHNFNASDMDSLTNIDDKLDRLNIIRNDIDNNFKKSFKKINLNGEDFNNVFINTSDKLYTTNEIVPRDINCYSMTNYSSTDNYNNLYAEDNNSTSSYSSYRSAFNIEVPNNIENRYNTHNLISKVEREEAKKKFNDYNIELRNSQNIFKND